MIEDSNVDIESYQFVDARSTKKASPPKWLECFCKFQEACCRGCIYFSQNYRGENGELRVGVRRAMRQQSNVPSSVISSHSMHLGVLATAWHAVSTGTMFTVYYKPRTSPSEFIVPFEQYMESVKNNHSIGMRFKMRFEGEEAPEQRFTGTIVGIGDVEPNRWPGSKWRCLKVRWDETTSIPRPERVSPWKIEPALAPPMSSAPMPRSKRPRPNVLPSSPDSSVLTREGPTRGTIDPSQVHGFARVLQGQEMTTLRSAFADSNESETAQKPAIWPQLQDDDKLDVPSAKRRIVSENWMQVMRHEPTYTDLLSGFRTPGNSHGFCSPRLDQPSNEDGHPKKHFQDSDGKFSLLSSQWSGMPSSPSLTMRDSSLKTPVQVNEMTYQKTGTVRYDALGGFPMRQNLGGEQQQGNWLIPFLSNSHFESPSHITGVKGQSVSALQCESMKPKGNGNYKLFGIHLDSNPVPSEPAQAAKNAAYEPEPEVNPVVVNHFQSAEPDQQSEPSKHARSADTAVGGSEQDKPSQPGPQLSRDAQSKHQGRSCTKVQKQGIALGRSVDLTKFSGYDELIAGLDRIFDFNGELMHPNKNWMIVYTDNEGDMMLVGDDPWQEFCSMVRKICIYTREEVQKLNSGNLNPKVEESIAVSEDGTKEVRNPALSRAADQDDC
ncbi:ADP-ribosylation factor 2 [Asimina triloba]